MSEKNEKCLAILKKYSLLVDFDDKAPMNPITPPIEGETFGRWKKRLWGDSAEHVVVYVPDQPNANTRIATLQRKADVNHLQAIFRQLAREQRQEKKELVEDTKTKTAKIYSTVPIDALQDAAAELADELQPAVSGFIESYRAKQPDDIGIDSLIQALLRNYNEAVKQLRQRENDIARR